MARSFEATNAPFDRLTPQQIGAVEAALDIGYFRPGETLIARDGAPELAVRRHQGLRRGARRRRGRRPARPRRLFRQPRPRPGRRIERLRRARGDAVQPRAARPHPQAHQRQRPFRRLLLSRDFAQARSGGARPGGGALQPAARRAGARRAAASGGLHRAERDDRQRRRKNAREQDQRFVRARRRARRPADRHAPRQSDDPRAQADRDQRRRAGEIRASSRSRPTISSRARC